MVLTQDSDVSAFIEEYCDAFRPGNSDEMAKYFYYPNTLIMNGTSTVVASPEKLRSLMAAGLSELEANGFLCSKLQELNVHKLAADIVIVSARFKRLKANDQVLEEIAATYTLLHGSNSGWTIAVTVVHDIDKLLR